MENWYTRKYVLAVSEYLKSSALPHVNIVYNIRTQFIYKNAFE